MTNSPQFIPAGIIPTEEQTAIQLAKNRISLVDANAGAAKTTTLALRIGEALARRLPADQILALTFTPEARDVLRQRMLDIGIPYATAEAVHVATFEDFAMWVLERIEGGAAPQLRHLRDIKPWLLEALKRVGERYMGKVEYLDIRTHNIALSQTIDAQLALKASLQLDTVDVEYAGVEEAAEILKTPLVDYLATCEYETLRSSEVDGVQFRGPYDATYDLARFLLQDARNAAQLPTYRIVVCDELHDLNEAGYRILSALLSAPDCWFVGVGDQDQVIHSKLGASSEFMESRFANDHGNTKRYPLTATWRHGPHLALAMAAFKSKTVTSGLPLHTEIRLSHYANATGCGDGIVAAVKAWKKEGYPLDGCAILLRDRHQAIAVERALMGAKIGYRTPPMAGYLQRDEILFLRGMIAIALKDLASVKALEVRAAIVEALAIFGEAPHTNDDLEKAKWEIAKNPQLLSEFYGRYLDTGQSTAIKAAIDGAANFGPDKLAHEALRSICDMMNLELAARRIFVRPQDAQAVAKSIQGFVATAEASGQTLAEFWKALNAAESFAGRKRDKDFVTVEYAVNAKGREFEHVILPFLEAGEFPATLADPGEEDNLFYVAATRAKARLTLLAPEAVERRSPYIARLGLSGLAGAAERAIVQNQAAAKKRVPSRHYLSAKFEEAPQVKALGAKFDWSRKAWYVESGLDLEPFRPWLKS